MFKNDKVLAIIPARKGSKRLPGKNYRTLKGKPLIEWTISAAKNSKYIDDIIISSDDSKILEIAKKNKVIDYERKKELSSDTASSVDVIIDIINNVKIHYSIIILLQPTTPLRLSTDIDTALELFNNKNADGVISVCESDHPIQWMNTLPANYSMNNFISEEVLSKRSQDFDKSYRLNGALYLIKPEVIKKQKTFFLKENLFAYIMPRDRSIDIDEEMDFRLAEVLLEEKRKSNIKN